MQDIPGGDCVKSIDNMSLEVLVREGTKLSIHRDQVKQWTNAGCDYEKDFEALRSHHAEHFENLLASVISGGASSGQSQLAGQPSTAVVALDEDPATTEGNQGQGQGQPEIAEVVSFESVAKLESVDKIKCRLASEFAGVELLKTESGKVFLLSEKGKMVPKHALLGGFGSGKQLGHLGYFLICYNWLMAFAKTPGSQFQTCLAFPIISHCAICFSIQRCNYHPHFPMNIFD